MRLWREIKAVFAEDVSVAELMDPSQAGAQMRRLVLLVREIYRSIRRDDVFNLAAALAFKTLLALVPVLAICLAVVATLDASGAAAKDAAAEIGIETKTYTDQFVDAIKSKLPDIAGMDDMVAQVHTFAKNAKAIAGIGFAFLFWTAFSLLNAIERSFNRIWQVKENRPLLGKLSAFLTTLIIVPVLMVLSVVMMGYIRHAAASALQDNSTVISETSSMSTGEQDSDTAGDAGTTLSRPVQMTARESVSPDDSGETSLPLTILLFCVSVFVTCIAMTAMFYLMPNTPVRLKAALVGGTLAGLTFELAKFGFRSYASHMVENFSRIYGPLLAVPLFLLWVWLVWIFILVGVEVAFTVQNFSDLAARAELEKRGIGARLYLAVRIVLRASRFFREGESPAEFVDRAAEELHVPPYMVREIVNELVEDNILRRVVPDEDNFVPAKDIHRLTVAEVVRAVQADALEVPDKPEDEPRRVLASLFGQVNAAAEDTLGACTFANLVELEERRLLPADTDDSGEA